MKKTYNKPELNVLYYGKDICCSNDIIAVSGNYDGEANIEAPGRRFDSWYEGF